MKKKKLKIKWGNVFKALIFVFCVGMILHDFYMLTIYSFITGNFCSLTWFGVITLFINIIIAGGIYEDFEEQIEKTPATHNN
mgnify:FL=1